ncbi:hypothetical protein KK001_14115 [Enterobacter roggenkampii]|uniref:hypothetical protein n=1 Tax=Enterobacter roggenkampii TaxID=1812935 RepID=UPI001BE0F1FE|nr:hypothetical protein [Enterobacter roggenkampii]MBT1889479.1 hypothetical protein [Enterobacter roggenkampii]
MTQTTYNALTDRRTTLTTFTDPVAGKTRAEQADILPIQEEIQPMEALPSKPVPVMVTPIEPPAPPATHFDESPLQLRIDLERTALKSIQAQLQRIDNLEQRLSGLDEEQQDTTTARINRVWHGDFTHNSNGQKLVHFLDVRGNTHMAHLMQQGAFDPSQNGGFIQRHQYIIAGTTARIFMVHESVRSLADLYDHPDNVAAVHSDLEQQRHAIESQIAQARIDLTDLKAGIKSKLKELEKRFKAILD